MVGDWGFEKAVAEWAVTCLLANEPESDDVENAAWEKIEISMKANPGEYSFNKETMLELIKECIEENKTE